MRRLITLLTALAIALAGATALSTPAQAVADRDCGDFDNQSQAQRFYLDQGGPQSDPHRLDADDDGRACDSLPCPCGTSSGGGGGGDTNTGGGGEKTLRQSARLIKVIDGDTIRVRLRSGARKDVRMIGLDTPEVYGGTECGGPKASRNLKRMLPRRARLTLISDTTQDRTDRYGRILRYVIHKNRDMNRAQIWSGHSKAYVYDRPFKRLRSYNRAERQAKRANRALWKHCW